MTTFQMESNKIIQISIIWITILLTALSNSQTIPKITNLDCFNDFKKKMFCFWEIDSPSNCKEDFQLKYTDFNNETLNCRDLGNDYSDGSRLLNKCICNITVVAFIASQSYKVELESMGTPVASTTIHIFSKVKPKRPSNVGINFSETDKGVVLWNTNYETNFIQNMLSSHIQFISKEDRKTVLEDTITQTESRYIFFKRQLGRGEDYIVRVRTKPAENQDLKGTWSEWSPEAEWTNDYSLTIPDLKSTIIPFSCIFLLILIISIYCCISSCKKNWWNNIPDPAKSSLAQIKLIQKNQFKSDGKSSATKVSRNCLSTQDKAYNKPKSEQLTQKLNFKDYLKFMEDCDLKKIIFVPEDEVIESCIQMYPKNDDEDSPCQEDISEDKYEDHLLGSDLSIGRMFCDILCDSSALKMETENFNIKNTFGNFGCSVFKDHYNKDETHLSLSEVSPEFGYHSYDSDDSPGDFNSQLDEPNTPFFDHSSGNQKDFLPYSPPFSINKSCPNVYKDDTFMNSGYNSFTNALAESRLDSIIDTTERVPISNLCFDGDETHLSLSEVSPEFGYHSYDSDDSPGDFHSQLDEPNTPFFDHSSGNQKDFLPYSPPFSINKSCPNVYKDDTFMNSGYNSFTNALAESRLDYIIDTTERVPISNLCFDGSSQSKMFCKPNNHNLLASPSSIFYYNTKYFFFPSGNEADLQIFNQPNFEQLSQCTVHNQGVDAGPPSVCEVSGYQSFDQAVQEDKTSGSTNCPVYDSGYKPFESLTSPSTKCLGDNGCLFKLDNQCHFSEHVEDIEEPPQTDMVISVPDPGDETKSFEKNLQKALLSPGLHLTEFSLVDFETTATEKHHPSYAKKFLDEYKDAVNRAAGIQCNTKMKLQDDDIPFALTFDICQHLRNFANIYGHKVSLNSLESAIFPINNAAFPCCLDETTFLHDHLSIKKSLPAQNCPPLKFENMSYFVPLYNLEAAGYSKTTNPLLVQQNNLDKEGNSYMKIALS